MERRGGDAAVAQALLGAAREAGFPEARVGVAGTCVAAAAATWERGAAWRVVPPGRDAAFLRRRPLDRVPMPHEMRAALRLLGLNACGELADLSAADVELRWGAAGVRAWRLSHADDERWPFRPPPPDRAAAEAEWEVPVEGTEPLRFVLRGLITSVTAQLARRQRVPAALRLVLRLAGASDHVHAIRPARPTAEARVLTELCDRALEQIAAAGRLPAPIAGARLEALEEGAALADQLDVFRPPAPDPAAVHAALGALLARWGDGALSRAALRGAHLPAAHAVWEPLGPRALTELTQPRSAENDALPSDAIPPAPDPSSPPSFPLPRSRSGATALRAAPAPSSHPSSLFPFPSPSALPLCLRRFPEPRAVRITTDARGRPLRGGAAPGRGNAGANGAGALRIGGSLRAEGPERISGGWWAGGYAREYWLVEEENGCLWLLFRDARDGGWWAEGWWD